MEWKYNSSIARQLKTIHRHCPKFIPKRFFLPLSNTSPSGKVFQTVRTSRATASQSAAARYPLVLRKYPFITGITTVNAVTHTNLPLEISRTSFLAHFYVLTCRSSPTQRFLPRRARPSDNYPELRVSEPRLQTRAPNRPKACESPEHSER